MNEAVENMPAPASADVQGILLGQWMGHREAFGLIAGRCSAADIEILRRMKEERLYATLDCTWDEFCTRHLHVARRTGDMRPDTRRSLRTSRRKASMWTAR